MKIHFHSSILKSSDWTCYFCHCNLYEIEQCSRWINIWFIGVLKPLIQLNVLFVVGFSEIKISFVYLWQNKGQHWCLCYFASNFKSLHLKLLKCFSLLPLLTWWCKSNSNTLFMQSAAENLLHFYSDINQSRWCKYTSSLFRCITINISKLNKSKSLRYKRLCHPYEGVNRAIKASMNVFHYV